MSIAHTPKTAAELAGLIAEGKPHAFQGLGTKSSLGRPAADLPLVSLAAFSGVVAYEPEELILEVGAATALADIQALLKTKHQHLAFEPPDLSRLLGATHGGSIGGVIACNLSGPRRLSAGAARDHIMGMTAVSGRGEIFKAGARVVKNVTGYDMPKLMAHSYGTLAIMTGIIMKVLPAPEASETMVISGLAVAEAVGAMSLAMQSSCEVSGAAYCDGQVLLRLEGIPASIIYRRDKLAGLFHGQSITIATGTDSQTLWRRVRNVMPLADDMTRDVWRLSVTPSDAPQILATIMAKADTRYFLDWAGGLIWLDLPASLDCGEGLVRGAVTSGHAMLIRAPQAKRQMISVFQPQEPQLAALTARVKHSFDPNGVLNPGRMYEGL
jgi:glycolate oxidase FAD binding subunit